MMAILVLSGCVQVTPDSDTNQDTKPDIMPDTKPDTKIDATQSEVDKLFDIGSYKEFSFEPLGSLEVKSFKDEDEYKSFTQSSGNDYYYPRAEVFATGGMVAIADDAMAVDMEESVKSAPSYSTTNNQVVEVDEDDIIKTDGQYIYTTSGNNVHILDAYPAEDTEIISTIELKETPQGLFINDDKLVVFGTYYNDIYTKRIGFYPMSGFTYFYIYDISDRKDPELVKDFKFEGNYFKARMYGDNIYFVVQSYPEYRVDYPTPLIIEDDVERSMPVDSVMYFDMPYRSKQLMTVHAVSLDDYDVDSTSLFVEWGQNLYMSEKNMYITYNEYINEYEIEQKITLNMLEEYLTSEDKRLIEKIKKADNEILSQAEKENKIEQIYYLAARNIPEDETEDFYEKVQDEVKKKIKEYEYFEYTIIHKIDVKDVEVVASGRVPGTIINQFSMDENGDIFRIATTINQRWYDGKMVESQSAIFTLDDDLDELDRMMGIAESERIYSTRFMGDRLYMVTFRQVDPFFVFDLSNEKNIKALGELKIPGFSRYLHPYDENTIMGIGQDADENGRVTGLKISLFDVSDVSKPKEVASYVGDQKYAQSSALWEHRAFLFDRQKNLMVIPVYNYEWNKQGNNYNGAFVFRVKEDSITLRGLIDHSQGQDRYWSPAVQRSLYIDDNLYTKSENLIRINSLIDLHSVKNVSLTVSQLPIPVY